VYGFKSVKWRTNIEIQTRPYGGDWYVHGWTVSGRIHTMTRIDLARRVGAEILLAGIAFAGTRGIKAVQVRVNGGPWREATLGAPLARSAWVQWAMRLRGHGPATIEARAVDGTGQVQTARRHDSFPDGATGWARAVV
jgi:DMSO/TMAO reductase YedYZ molybdopterin-dependent catalytic subunit